MKIIFVCFRAVDLLDFHLSESYLHKRECKKITEVLDYKIVPKTFRRLVDNSYTRYQERLNTDMFLEILNKQDQAIKYTVEFEDQKHLLSFLYINITNIERM